MDYQATIKKGWTNVQKTIHTLPIVVHIVHNNGPENITVAQVLQGIEHLNQAFQNIGYYDPTTGVDTEIQFCLAKQTPDGLPTNGINRFQSPSTDMSIAGAGNIYDATWNTYDYINIRLVKEACINTNCAAVAGYGHLPYSHGLTSDGIVMEAKYFGSSPDISTIIVHEMGHYLGLWHTFQGGCKNGDCLSDGDRVCDTPPDNVNTISPCNAPINSCQSDTDDPSTNNPYRDIALGGLGDQNDHLDNYMDYVLKDCRKSFTQGQKDRMHYFLENVRNSLLDSKACLPPCPLEPTAFFSADQTIIEAGEMVTATNLSENANGFNWYVDGVYESNSNNEAFVFEEEGVYVIHLEATSPLVECGTDIFEMTITVTCPVSADLDWQINGDWLVFNDQSTNANTIGWEIRNSDGSSLLNSTHSIDSIIINNLQYIQLCLNVANQFCEEELCEFINLTGNNTEICDNGIDDDGDGMVDLYDPDCTCIDTAFQAFCPIDCEYLPNSFSGFQMKLKWVSEIISNEDNTNLNIVVGDIDNDGNTEVMTKSHIGDWMLNDVVNNIKGFNGENGSTIINFPFSSDSFYYAQNPLSMADIDKDGQAEFFSISLSETVLSYTNNGDLLWESDILQKGYRNTLANITDFNKDGVPELYLGNEILNSLNGKTLAFGNEGKGGNLKGGSITLCRESHSIAAELLPSDGIELAAGNTVYQIQLNNLDGTSGNSMSPIIAPDPVKDGFTSVGDINGDGKLDIIVVRDNNYDDGGGIWVWDPRTLEILASAPAGENGGVAFLGDIDGDRLPEIGMTFSFELRMYRYDGTNQLQLLYSIPTTDESGLTGITMFDFNQDGKQELIYRDQTDLRIIEGSTGNIIALTPLKSLTWMEHPIVADVDNDGEAEILVNGYEDENNIELRIYCFESAPPPWAPARSVWNQYGYHVTNVNDDLTIPRQQQNQAAHLEGHENCLRPTCPAPYNAFLAQATYRTQEGCVQFPAVDLAIEIIGMDCTPDSLEVCVEVQRLGSRPVTDTIGIAIYPSNPTILSSQPIITTSLVFNDSSKIDTICITVANMFSTDSLYLIINDFGLTTSPYSFPITDLTECNYTNNIDAIALPTIPPPIDLGPDITKCESEVITFNAGAGFETYQWNDGTLDSIYSSSFEGLHFVTATDACGRTYSDTVEIIIDAINEVELGMDREVCPGEDVQLSLSGDYDFVQWLPADNVDCDDCMDVTVQAPQGLADSSFSLMVVVGKESCYSSDTLSFLIKEKIEITDSESICEGDTLDFMGSDLTVAGEYEFDLNSCDSFLLLDLQILPKDTSMMADKICMGDSVLFGGNWLKDSGLFTETATNTAGCDSLVLFDLSVLENISSSDTLSICEGDSVQVFSQWIKGDTLLSEVFTSTSGCDSLHSFWVASMPLPYQSLGYDICMGDSIQVGGTWLNEAGFF